jgi:hypothetical protein
MEKPFEEFSKRKDSKDGYRNDCKECKKSWARNHHSLTKDEKKEQILNRRRRFYDKNKIKLFQKENDRVKSKKENNPLYYLSCKIRVNISTSFYRLNIKKKIIRQRRF